MYGVKLQHLHSYSLEEARVSERKLHHLFDLRQLLPTASDVVVADVVKALFLILLEGDTQESALFEFICCNDRGVCSVAGTWCIQGYMKLSRLQDFGDFAKDYVGFNPFICQFIFWMKKKNVLNEPNAFFTTI